MSEENGITMVKEGIHDAILAVMADVPAIPKTHQNPQQKYQFRGVDDVMSALNPLFARHGVFVVPTVLSVERESRESKSGGTLMHSILTVKYTFYAKDGSSIEAVAVGEGMDSSDKSVNKAMSGAFKYVLFQVFCIATDEPKDSEQDTPEPKGKPGEAATGRGKAAPNGKADTEASEKQDVPPEVKKVIQRLNREAHGLAAKLGKSHDALHADACEHFKREGAAGTFITSTTQMTVAQWQKLIDFYQAQIDAEGSTGEEHTYPGGE